MEPEPPSRSALLVPLGSSLPLGVVTGFALSVASFGLGSLVKGGGSAVTTVFAATDFALLILLGALAGVGLVRAPSRALFVVLVAWAASRCAMDARIASLGGRLDVADLLVTMGTAVLLAALVVLARHRRLHGAEPSGLSHVLARAEQAASVLLVVLGLAFLGGAVTRAQKGARPHSFRPAVTVTSSSAQARSPHLEGPRRHARGGGRMPSSPRAAMIAEPGAFPLAPPRRRTWRRTSRARGWRSSRRTDSSSRSSWSPSTRCATRGPRSR